MYSSKVFVGMMAKSHSPNYDTASEAQKQIFSAIATRHAFKQVKGFIL